MFIKTNDFLIYRPIKYCVTSMILKPFKHNASVKSQHKFKYLLLVNYFHVSDHHHWQATRTRRCTAEVDTYIPRISCRQNR